YQLPFLPVGAYRLILALPGWKTLNIDNVDISNQPATVNARLAIAATAEEVTVLGKVSDSSQQSLAEATECVAPPPAAPLAQPQPGRIRQGGDVSQARLLAQPRPIY